MIILVEGVDKSGKSTLIDLFLQQNHAYKKYRSNHQKDKKIDLEVAIKHDWRFFLDICSQTDQNIIFDRSFISQYVYSMIFRKKNILNHFSSIEEYQKIFKEYCIQLSELQYKVFYCFRNDYTNVIDDYLDISYHKKLKEQFTNFFNLFKNELVITTLNFEDGLQINLQKMILEIN